MKNQAGDDTDSAKKKTHLPSDEIDSRAAPLATLAIA
jgi:hypothetical protein